MGKGRMERSEIDAQLCGIDDQLEKAIIVLGFIPDYARGEGEHGELYIIRQGIEIAVKMAREAQHDVVKLRQEVSRPGKSA